MEPLIFTIFPQMVESSEAESMSKAVISSRRENLTNNEYGPYSIHNNWRVPVLLPEIPKSSKAPPIAREWLRDLLRQHSQNCQTPMDLKDKALIVAPMVDQSDLPFRMQCRKYGSNLCVTPMIHTRLFQDNEAYRNKFRCDNLPACDRPILAQLCGPDPSVILKTALEIAPYVDGIDLNCGCPQAIAKRGLYGAFLLEEPDLLLSIVHTLVSNLDIPVTVKVRLLPSGLDDSLRLYTKLVDAGISMLTVHGRTRLQTQRQTGSSDWDAVRTVVRELGSRIPIVANGGIASLADVRSCLAYTGADGVMSSEALLEYPALFVDETFPHRRSGPGRLQLAREYLELAQRYPPEEGGQGSGFKTLRAHVHKFLHEDLQRDPDFRTICVEAETMKELEDCLSALEKLQLKEQHDVTCEKLAWYRRHRDREIPVLSHGVRYIEIADDTGDCFGGLFGTDDDEEDL
jgi:tRNA-dihydrouridine synthase 1